MRYLLDTTVLSPYFANDPDARLLLRKLAPEGISVSIVPRFLRWLTGMLSK